MDEVVEPKRKPGRPRRDEEVLPPVEPLQVVYRLRGLPTAEFRCSRWHDTSEFFVFQGMTTGWLVQSRYIRKSELSELSVLEPPRFTNQPAVGIGPAFPTEMIGGLPPSAQSALSGLVAAGPPHGSYNAQAGAKAFVGERLVTRMTEQGPVSTVDGEHGLEVIPVGFFTGEPPA